MLDKIFVLLFNQEVEHGAVSNLNYSGNFYRDKEDDRRKQDRMKKESSSETMARKTSAIYEEKTQNGHHRTNTGNRNNTNRLVWKRS